MADRSFDADALAAAREWATEHGHQTPDDRMLRAYGDKLRAVLAETLRYAAKGRRVYAGSPHSYSEMLEGEAVMLDSAARVVEGDVTPLRFWLPTWMWSDEMHDQMDREEQRTEDGADDD